MNRSPNLGSRVACTLEWVVHSLCKGLAWVFSGVAAILILLTVINTGGRYFFDAPVPGSIEISSLGLLVMVFSSMAYTTWMAGHVKTGLLAVRLPRRAQDVIASIMTLMGAIVFALASWQLGLAAAAYSGQLTTDLRIPVYPFRIVASIGAGVICLELFITFLHSLGKWK